MQVLNLICNQNSYNSLLSLLSLKLTKTSEYILNQIIYCLSNKVNILEIKPFKFIFFILNNFLEKVILFKPFLHYFYKFLIV
jgi:hypothetical protein